MTSIRFIRLAASALIALGLGQAAFAQDDLSCRKRALYDYCGAVMVAATGQLLQAADGQATIDKLNADFNEAFGAFKELPEHKVIQKNVMLSALEHFSLDSVKACTGRNMEMIGELITFVDLECRENQ
jgi:hypothetical protein